MQAADESPRIPAVNRRDALRAAGAAALISGGMQAVHGQTPSADLIRVGVIGAGGRGSGALKQTLSVPGSNVKVTAVADAFPDRVRGALNALRRVEIQQYAGKTHPVHPFNVFGFAAGGQHPESLTLQFKGAFKANSAGTSCY